MMSGAVHHPAVDVGEGGSRKLGNGRQSPTSPLKLFGLAKKRINDIFVDISKYMHETNTFLVGKFTRMLSLLFHFLCELHMVVMVPIEVKLANPVFYHLQSLCFCISEKKATSI